MPLSDASAALMNETAWNRHAVLTCAEMRRAEELAAAQNGGDLYPLMQHAGAAVAAIIREKWTPRRTLVLCGPGNNGGDGYVCAEALRGAGWDVTVACLRDPAQLSGDARRAADEWRGPSVPLHDAPYEQSELIVDALFGTGLARAMEGTAKVAIEKMAASRIPVVSIDLPSGVNADTGAVLGAASQAALTVTFFRKKPAHLLLPGAALCGEIVVADIGIGDEALESVKPQAAENAPALWRGDFPVPKAEGHKYARGHALIYGGAVMTGAARLAARAAQRMGAGLVTLAAPPEAVPVYAGALESVIVRQAVHAQDFRALLDDAKRNAVLIGPGLGVGDTQAALVREALTSNKTAVLDADALTTFTQNPDNLIGSLHPRCVLTPHEGEFARVFGSLSRDTGGKLDRVRRAAEAAGCVVLLKGADTVIAEPGGQAVINSNAPPWLATAGAGDVLAGMILGLAAQGMPLFAAAAAAAWMHGHIAAGFGPGLIAEDLVDGIPPALAALNRCAR